MVAAWCSALPAAEKEFEIGTIDMMSEGVIYVTGQRGTHVLEPLGDCDWCRVGQAVVVRFKGYIRATLSPYGDSQRIKPLKVLIVRDGRDEG